MRSFPDCPSAWELRGEWGVGGEGAEAQGFWPTAQRLAVSWIKLSSGLEVPYPGSNGIHFFCLSITVLNRDHTPIEERKKALKNNQLIIILQ